MPTVSPTSPTDEVARLRAELADLPNQIEDATEAGDEDRLAKLLVRDRVLGRMIAQAEVRVKEHLLEGLQSERDRLHAEFSDAVHGLPDLELAASVYARAVVNRKSRTEPLRQQLNHVERRIRELEQEIPR